MAAWMQRDGYGSLTLMLSNGTVWSGFNAKGKIISIFGGEVLHRQVGMDKHSLLFAMALAMIALIWNMLCLGNSMGAEVDRFGPAWAGSD